MSMVAVLSICHHLHVGGDTARLDKSHCRGLKHRADHRHCQ